MTPIRNGAELIQLILERESIFASRELAAKVKIEEYSSSVERQNACINDFICTCSCDANMRILTCEDSLSYTEKQVYVEALRRHLFPMTSTKDQLISNEKDFPYLNISHIDSEQKVLMTQELVVPVYDSEMGKQREKWRSVLEFGGENALFLIQYEVCIGNRCEKTIWMDYLSCFPQRCNHVNYVLQRTIVSTILNFV